MSTPESPESPPVDPVPRDPRQPADFDPLALGKQLLRSIRVGALGTLDPQGGHPFVTLTSVATDFDGTPFILISRLSQHTQNLLADQRASLMLSQGGKGDPLAHPRLTLQAMAEPEQAPRLRARFLARHPKAQIYVDFPDFAFFRLRPLSLHLNGGFARAFDGPAALILTPVADLPAFGDLERSALEHMNADHVDALSLYATALCGMPPGRWRATGLDPDGLDLALGDATARVSFPERIEEPGRLRLVLKQLADAARERAVS
jgi:putative heme iron utilization protein